MVICELKSGVIQQLLCPRRCYCRTKGVKGAAPVQGGRSGSSLWSHPGDSVLEAEETGHLCSKATMKTVKSSKIGTFPSFSFYSSRLQPIGWCHSCGSFLLSLLAYMLNIQCAFTNLLTRCFYPSTYQVFYLTL